MRDAQMKSGRKVRALTLAMVAAKKAMAVRSASVARSEYAVMREMAVKARRPVRLAARR